MGYFEIVGGPLDGKRISRPTRDCQFYGKVLDNEGSVALHRWDAEKSQWKYIGIATGIYTQDDLGAYIRDMEKRGT